ncbi:MAG TPA: DUF4157 domain-containing protein [Acidobacteriaceae bacterium]
MRARSATLAATSAKRTQQTAKDPARARNPVRDSALQRKLATPLGTVIPKSFAGIPSVGPGESSPAERSTHQTTPLQRRLVFGAGNNPLETQADAMAAAVMNDHMEPAVRPGGPIVRQAVMRMLGSAVRPFAGPSFSGPVLQRKCACGGSGGECDACTQKPEEGLLQRKTVSRAPANGVPPIVHEALRSPGQMLDSTTRSFFELRFHHDFSHVRVHTSASAAESARAVNALAYTVGHNVAFDTGRYSPQTTNGKRLLAHELAHVIQQSRGAGALGSSMTERGLEQAAEHAAMAAMEGERVQVDGIASQHIARVPTTPADFPVTGKKKAPGDTMNIYFDRNSAVLDAVEQAKIPQIVSTVTPTIPVVLNGFRSEDEPVALASTRATAVSAALSAAVPPHTGAQTVTPLPAAGVGHIDYRDVRKVEVLAAPAAAPPPVSAVPACSAGPSAPCGTAFSTAQPRALAMLNAAIPGLNAPLSANATTLLSTLFGGAGVAATVRSKLVLLRDHITAMPSQMRCHNICDGNCTNPAYNCGVGIGVPAADPCNTAGSKAMMTLCPDFLSEPNVDKRAQTLIHEGAHGTATLQTVDLSYGVERGIILLSPADTLRNTDSYVLLVRNLHTPGSVSIGPTPPDVVTGAGSCPTADPVICRAVAFLEKWAVTARQDISGVYDAVVVALPPGAWTASYYQALLHDIASLFGLTDPGAAAPFVSPVGDDKLKLAGIYDRYNTMMYQIYSNRVTINKVPAGAESWTFGSPATLTLTPTFSAVGSVAGQVRRLYELLATATPGVTAALRPSYVEAADRIRRHRSFGP